MDHRPKKEGVGTISSYGKIALVSPTGPLFLHATISSRANPAPFRARGASFCYTGKMHEFALAHHLLGIILPKVPEETKVTRIDLAIGVLAGVSLPSLEFGFEVASEGTPAQGAKLSVRTVGLSCRCKTCALTYAPDTIADPASWCCPSCGEGLGEILTGREMEIEQIEVE